MKITALLTRLVDQRDESLRQSALALDLLHAQRAGEVSLMTETLKTAQMMAEASKAQAQALTAYFGALQAGYSAPAAPPDASDQVDVERMVSNTFMDLYGPPQAEYIDTPQ